MATGHHAYMRKEGEKEIIKVPMNEWGRYRKSGYVFSNEADYNAQRAASPARDDDDKPTPKVSKKKMRRHATRL